MSSRTVIGLRARARAGEHGAVAVEFALVLPFLLVIVFGSIQYGFYFWADQGGSDAARKAARLAAVLPLPKERAAIDPGGFTRRYGNTIAARIGVVRRDALDGCVYGRSA